MAEKHRSDKKNYIEEHNVTIELLDRETGLTMFKGSAPPRVEKIDVLSCFLGVLRVGDWVLSVDKRTMKSPKDFHDATRLEVENKPKIVDIRFKRDNFFKMLAVKTTILPNKPDKNFVYFQIRWRSELPIGIVVASQAGAVVVSSVETGSVAAEHFRTGDILMEVNEKCVRDCHAAKKLIRKSIVATSGVNVKVERDVAPPKRIVKPPADVQAIMSGHRGFWSLPCKLRPIDEPEATTSNADVARVHQIQEVSKERVAVEKSDKELKPTPRRDGSSHD